jgi:hypothetical protein
MAGDAEQVEEAAASAPTPGAPNEPAAGSDAAGSTGQLADAMGGLLRVLFSRGKVEVERAAATGRVRLELRQLRRDRDIMYQKLGRELRALVEAGEVTHPGLVRGVARLDEMDANVRAVEAKAAVGGVVDAPAASDGNPPVEGT